MKLTGILVVVGSVAAGVLAGSANFDENSNHTFLINREYRPVASSEVIRVPIKIGNRSYMSPHSSPIAVSDRFVFAVNTPADTLDVIEKVNNEIVHRINVGIDPVSVVVRPDGKEAWVANHISDSVSVIDIDSESLTCFQVVATIQAFEKKGRATYFDEPVGIAFAGNEKAYVALSAENEIAVVDVPTRQLVKRLEIVGQDPRAISVRGDRLYVIPFESNNQTQLSGGKKEQIGSELVTFDAWDHSISNNNVLSLGHVVDIVKHPKVPDRDLFIFDTKTDELIETVDSLGTLLYGVAVDSKGRVFVAQTDARNDVNGRAGTKKHGLAELGNRAFLNQITKVEFSGLEASQPEFIDLEPAPPAEFDPQDALATPFAIKVSDDDQILVVTAAGSDKLFTVNPSTGKVLGRVGVGSVPRGIALESKKTGEVSRAWVHNSIANTVSIVELGDPAQPILAQTISLEDPTPAEYKHGRAVFNSAKASTSGTFSCASCHPDGHTDQLLWVLKTPVVTGGNQIMPRSTMPLRGLRDTAPFHWDGIPGDPYGGNNSASIRAHVEPNSDPNVPVSTIRSVVDGSLSSTMSTVGLSMVNDEGKVGALSRRDRDALSKFLLDVPFPPAQRRAYTNVLSPEAKKGFELFHISGDDDPSKTKFNVCGDCHRMPYLVSTNTPGTGMDAPTWRGAYDRWLILPQGRLNMVAFPFFRRIAETGLDEESIWKMSWGGRARFNPVWKMVLEGSTGVSGALGRQITLNRFTVKRGRSVDLLKALEDASAEGAVVLQVDGVFLNRESSSPVQMQFDAELEGGKYRLLVERSKVSTSGSHGSSSFDFGEFYSREELLHLANQDLFVGTFTARHASSYRDQAVQPALWTKGSLHAQRGHQKFPFLYEGNLKMSISGRHVAGGAVVIVDGRRVAGSVETQEDNVEIELVKLPSQGLHLLQVQNPNGLFSNDFIFHVTNDQQAAIAAERKIRRDRVPSRLGLWDAISENDLPKVKEFVRRGANVSARHPENGRTPLGQAALLGNVEAGKFLIQRGARVSGSNRDGNTSLHVATFLCDFEFVELLLRHGADRNKKNGDGRIPVEVVNSNLSKRTAEIYKGIGKLTGRDFEIDKIRKSRPKMVQLLRDYDRASDTDD